MRYRCIPNRGRPLARGGRPLKVFDQGAGGTELSLRSRPKGSDHLIVAPLAEQPTLLASLVIVIKRETLDLLSMATDCAPAVLQLVHLLVGRAVRPVHAPDVR